MEKFWNFPSPFDGLLCRPSAVRGLAFENSEAVTGELSFHEGRFDMSQQIGYDASSDSTSIDADCSIDRNVCSMQYTKIQHAVRASSNVMSLVMAAAYSSSNRAKARTRGEFITLGSF